MPQQREKEKMVQGGIIERRFGKGRRRRRVARMREGLSAVSYSEIVTRVFTWFLII